MENKFKSSERRTEEAKHIDKIGPHLKAMQEFSCGAPKKLQL